MEAAEAAPSAAVTTAAHRLPRRDGHRPPAPARPAEPGTTSEATTEGSGGRPQGDGATLPVTGLRPERPALARSWRCWPWVSRSDGVRTLA